MMVLWHEQNKPCINHIQLTTQVPSRMSGRAGRTPTAPVVSAYSSPKTQMTPDVHSAAVQSSLLPSPQGEAAPGRGRPGGAGSGAQPPKKFWKMKFHFLAKTWSFFVFLPSFSLLFLFFLLKLIKSVVYTPCFFLKKNRYQWKKNSRLAPSINLRTQHRNSEDAKPESRRRPELESAGLFPGRCGRQPTAGGRGPGPNLWNRNYKFLRAQRTGEKNTPPFCPWVPPSPAFPHFLLAWLKYPRLLAKIIFPIGTYLLQ